MRLRAMKVDQSLLDEVQAKAEALKLARIQLARILNVSRYHLDRIFMGAYTEEEWLYLVKFTNLKPSEIEELIHAHRLASKFERSGLLPTYKDKRFKRGDDIYAMVHAIEHKYGDMLACPADDLYLKTMYALLGVKIKPPIYDKNVLERLRKERGMNEQELSEAVGYHRTWYKQFINGTKFTLEHAIMFSQYFGVKTSYFEITDWSE